MTKQKHSGDCHICGCDGPLSYEHVPPKKAFNDRPILLAKINEKIIIKQKGSGSYTLCMKCNNNTGSWYASSYVDFVQQAFSVTSAALGAPSLHYPFNIYPLRVIKQVMCMFCSTNPASFAKKNEEIIRFLLNPEDRYLPDHMNVYMYYNLSELGRTSGVVGIISDRGTRVFSEIAYPPLGFILTLDGMEPTANCLNITAFSEFNYNQLYREYLKIPILEINTILPGDFRTQNEIERDRQNIM